jgi:PAS domain S-box-containing protein
MPHASDPVARYRSAARAAGAAAAILGGLVLVGWILDITALTRIAPGPATMKPNTAALFMLLGGAVMLQGRDDAAAPRARTIARVCGLLAAAVAGATLIESFAGVDLGIDQLLIRVPGEGLPAPGRMAPNTAICFLAIGAAIALLDSRAPRLRSLAQALAIGTLFIAAIAATGHLLGVTELYSIEGHAAMAIHTAIGILLLVGGVLLVQPDHGVVAILAQQNPAGADIRRLMPVIVLIPLGLAWLRLKGEQAGYYGTEFGLALMVVASTTITTTLSLWSARKRGASEAARQSMVETLHRDAQDLELLIRVGEALRASTDEVELLHAVSRQVAQHLGVPRCMFVEVDLHNDRGVIRRDVHGAYPSLAGTYSIASFGEGTGAELRKGKTLSITDLASDRRTAAVYATVYVPLGIRARLSVPLLRGGTWVASLTVCDDRPRAWQAREIDLLSQVAERVWVWIEHLRAQAHARKRSVQQAVERTEARFRLLVEAIQDYAVFMLDARGTVATWNAGAQRIKGYVAGDIIGRPLDVFYTPEDIESGHPQHVLECARRDGRYEEEGWRVRRDGTRFWASVVLTAMRDASGAIEGFAKVTRDITDRRRQEEELRERQARLSQHVRERDVLLQEIHHRVKNNLQVISSLINMQTRQLPAGASREALEECQSRVLAIALIHEQLYQSNDYAEIQFSDYARSLAASVFHTHGISRKDIKLELAIAPIPLSIKRAIPCGLVINELITNALKHAFPGDRGGTICVSLERLADKLQLEVRDDGVGLPERWELASAESMGLRLVRTLTRQLAGELAVHRQPGACFQITFPEA